MTKLTKLSEVTDPDAMAYVTDAFGQAMAAVYLHDLRTWVWAVERVDSWLQHASAAARDDYAEFMADRFGPCHQPSVDDLSWMLSAVATRMRLLVNEVPS